MTEANQHVRTLSHGIMPVQIDAEGLRSALTELTTDTSEQQKIRCRFEFVGSGFLANNSIATQLYRIAQESLSNAIKHGQANDVLITLSQHFENIVLEVQDNGVGFDPQATSRPASGSDGFGLRIMEYRASMLGGDLRVDRSDQTGTIVRCTVPVTGVPAMSRLKPRLRIMVVDDHPMMRDGLVMRISSQSDMEVCGEAESEDGAVELAKQVCPDLALIDISLKSGDGIELIKRLRMLNSSTKMLVVSAFQESLYAERAMRAGALGYLNKQESNEKLIEAIRAVCHGERYVSSDITQRLVSQALGKRSETQNPIELLTDRELEVFKLIGLGHSTSTIADKLLLSTHTIDTHRENIKRKLGCKNGADLIRQAIQSMLESG